MKTNNIYIILTALLLSGCPYRAQKTPEVVKELKFSCNKPIKFVFINGILNKKKDAVYAKGSLSRATNADFKILFNESENAVRDLIKAYKQKKSQNDIRFSENIKEAIEEIIAEFDKIPDKIYTVNDKKEIDRYVRMSEKYKLFIVAHSQGNFFANELCDQAKIMPELHGFATPRI